MRRLPPLPLLLSGLAVTTPPAASDWSYVEPEYPCSPTTAGCFSGSHTCLANPNHPQRTDDASCAPCHKDQEYWPCDVDNLCFCWDHSMPKIPPAPGTRLYNNGEGLKVSDVDPCDLVAEEVFERMAPMAQHPYSYAGFCAAVRRYNENHPKEGVFNMGSTEQQKSELAAFFGNSLHESDEFKAGREYLMCADKVEQGGEVFCRPCDAGSFDWETMTCPEGASLASQGRAFNSYCQGNLEPPEGCACEDVYEANGQGPMAGYVKANQVFFGRGSIQLSWNYNYISASVALTGASQTFCQRPDLVATNEEYAWGAGLFFWMENVKNDKTCHQSVLLNDEFGETLDNINGGLECPADDHGWHGKAVQMRLNRYCRAATAIGVEKLLSLEGCMDMDKKMRQCLEEGNCDDCRRWEETLDLDGNKEVLAEDVDLEAVAQNSGGGGGGSGVGGGGGGNGCKKNPAKCAQQNNGGGDAASDAGSAATDASVLGIDCCNPQTKQEKKVCRSLPAPTDCGPGESELAPELSVVEVTVAETTEPTLPPPPPTARPSEPAAAVLATTPVDPPPPPPPVPAATTDPPVTSRPTISPTPRPTPHPTWPPAIWAPSSSAGQFVAGPSKPAPATGPAASQFGFGSKPSASGFASAPASSPASSEDEEEEGALVGMTNWANIPLIHPPTDQPVASPEPPPPTPPPSKFPTKPPTRHPTATPPPTDPITDRPTAGTSQTLGLGSLDAQFKEEEMMVPQSDSASAGETLSHFSQLSDGSFRFAPRADATVSRSAPGANFGSDPSLVVDTLEGDVALLRFDLSPLSDAGDAGVVVVERAILRLSPVDRDGVAGSGVYYVQPTAGDWTEDGVMYDDAPPAGGALFASFAKHGGGDERHLDLDVTKAAKHGGVVNFKIIGTDGVRSEFASREDERHGKAPALVVTLRSAAAQESATAGTGGAHADGAASPQEPPPQGGGGKGSGGKGSGGKGEGEPPPASSAAASDPASPPQSSSAPFAGRISGRVWLDRDADGVRGPTEPGARGVPVDLYACDGDGWARGTRTGLGGDYAFNDLDEGGYYVAMSIEDDFELSSRLAGDSHVDPATGRSDCVELSSKAKESIVVDAGVVQRTSPASLPAATADTDEMSKDEGAAVSSDDLAAANNATNVDEDSGEGDLGASLADNCRGKPCSQVEEEIHCRSKYGFCGSGEEFCNADSQWTEECGTPVPTARPSLTPTTGRPTFLHDPSIHCVGVPCGEEEGEEGNDGTWCRSEIGYCGPGPLYCNAGSSWVPKCDYDGDDSGGESLLSIQSKLAAAAAAAAANGTETPNMMPVANEILTPTRAPQPKDTEGFAPFVLPTLMDIIDPKETDTSALKKFHVYSRPLDDGDDNDDDGDDDDNGNANDNDNEHKDDDDVEVQSDASNNREDELPTNFEDSSWFVQMEQKPIPRNAGRPESSSFARIHTLLCCSLVFALWRL